MTGENIWWSLMRDQVQNSVILKEYQKLGIIIKWCSWGMGCKSKKKIQASIDWCYIWDVLYCISISLPPPGTGHSWPWWVWHGRACHQRRAKGSTWARGRGHHRHRWQTMLSPLPSWRVQPAVILGPSPGEAVQCEGGRRNNLATSYNGLDPHCVGNAEEIIRNVHELHKLQN